jgi:predicted nucleic acid-binding protein
MPATGPAVADVMIAATVFQHWLTVVSRNIRGPISLPSEMRKQRPTVSP